MSPGKRKGSNREIVKKGRRLELKVDVGEGNGGSSVIDSDGSCPICCENFSFRTTLPLCGHEFCFLCIKGASMRGGSCPMCRRSIDKRLFSKPTVEQHHQQRMDIQPQSDEAQSSAHPQPPTPASTEEIYWLYESRGSGWWRFEKRQESELEEAFGTGAKTHELLIAGYLYIIDFKLMMQYRKDSQRSTHSARRVRRVGGNREFSELESSIIGVAGLHQQKP